jgi:acetylornithine deacetylase/succinyl-diaminopimelate desuccinylase-like protein
MTGPIVRSTLATLVEEVIALAEVPAPTFAEAERLAWLERRLEGAPGSRRRDAVGNLVWSWGDGRPRLVVVAHVDTVFPGGTDLTVRREGEHLVGPGIGDNAAAVVVAVRVTEALLAAEGGKVEPGAVVFTVGEEGLGNLRGAREAVRALDPDALIALEGHMLDEVVVDAVGSLRARVTVRGPGGHSWQDRGGPGAIDGLLGLAAELRALSEPDSPVNLGTIEGGRSVNTIADRAELLVERRALGQAPLAEFESALQALSLPEPLTVDVEVLGRRPAGRLDRAAPLLSAVLAVRARLGLEPRLTQGSTDANAALAVGVPALCIGCARGAAMHALDERIDASTLELGTAQLDGVMREILL